MNEHPQSSSAFNRLLEWLSKWVASPEASPRRSRLILAGTIIFLIAFGIRWLHWQDYQLNIGADQSSLVNF